MEHKKTPAGMHYGAALKKILFKADAGIEGREPGVEYEVDQALASHYVDKLGVATYVGAPKKTKAADRAVGSAPRDRAIRRRRKG